MTEDIGLINVHHAFHHYLHSHTRYVVCGYTCRTLSKKKIIDVQDITVVHLQLLLLQLRRQAGEDPLYPTWADL
jgi:hypothetical protein